MALREISPRHPNFVYPLNSRRLCKKKQQKNLEATLLFVYFSKSFDSIHKGKMERIFIAYGLHKKLSQQ